MTTTRTTKGPKWTRDWGTGVYRAFDDRLRIEKVAGRWELQIRGEVVGTYRTLNGAKGPAADYYRDCNKEEN